MKQVKSLLLFISFLFSWVTIFAQIQDRSIILLFSYLNSFQNEFYIDDYSGENLNPEGIIIWDTTSNPESVWQVCIPNKGDWTDGAGASWPNPLDLVLITDSINPYPTNNESIIDLILDKPEWAIAQNRCWSKFIFSFAYKCDTDTLLDGLEVYISLDGGNQYVNAMSLEDILALPNSPEPSNIFGVFSESPGAGFIHGISGKSPDLIPSSGWESFSLEMIWDNEHVYDVTQARIKLVFKSDDNQTNRKGILIDGIHLSLQDWCHIINTPINITNTIQVYPNPANNSFQVSSSNPSNLNIIITNIFGEIVFEQFNFSENLKINCSSWPPGMYYYKIFNGSQILTSSKIIIE